LKTGNGVGRSRARAQLGLENSNQCVGEKRNGRGGGGNFLFLLKAAPTVGKCNHQDKFSLLNKATSGGEEGNGGMIGVLTKSVDIIIRFISIGRKINRGFSLSLCEGGYHARDRGIQY